MYFHLADNGFDMTGSFFCFCSSVKCSTAHQYRINLYKCVFGIEPPKIYNGSSNDLLPTFNPGNCGDGSRQLMNYRSVVYVKLNQCWWSGEFWWFEEPFLAMRRVPEIAAHFFDWTSWSAKFLSQDLEAKSRGQWPEIEMLYGSVLRYMLPRLLNHETF